MPGVFRLTLISVDSALVYRGLDIGSAKPDAATLGARYPHRLIDIRDPAQAYSAAEFRADALREMRGDRRDIPVAFRCWSAAPACIFRRCNMASSSPLPEADPELRARLAEEATRQQLARPACTPA